MQKREEPIDPRMQEMFDLLRSTPRRDPQAAARGKARFLTEVDQRFPAGPETSRWSLSSFFSNLSLSLPLRAVLASLVVILVIGIGGARITAAARSSLPGNRLYLLKTGLEHAELTVKSDPGAQAQLYLEFAGRRLDEIEGLIKAGRSDLVPPLTTEFLAYIQKTVAATHALAITSPARAALLEQQISITLTSYTQTLSELATNAPETLRPDLENALDGSRNTLLEQSVEDNHYPNPTQAVTPVPIVTPSPEITPQQKAPNDPEDSSADTDRSDMGRLSHNPSLQVQGGDPPNLNNQEAGDGESSLATSQDRSKGDEHPALKGSTGNQPVIGSGDSYNSDHHNGDANDPRESSDYKNQDHSSNDSENVPVNPDTQN